MGDGDTIPGTVCSACGSALIAVRMTVESTEAFCPFCELHEGWRHPIFPHRVKYTYTDDTGATIPGEMVVNAEDHADAWTMVQVYRRGLRDLKLDRVYRI